MLIQIAEQQMSGRKPHELQSLWSLWARREPPATYGVYDVSDFSDHHPGIELRDAAEAPCPITPEALRLPMEEVPGLTPAPGQRLVLCCASGLRAWRAGLTLQAQGIENMSIIAAKACA